MKSFLAILLICARPVWSQPSSAERWNTIRPEDARTLVFQVWPAQARLFYPDNSRVATRGQAFSFSHPKGTEILHCEFRCPGYEPLPLRMDWADVVRWSESVGSRYPDALQLKPQTPSAYLHTYPILNLGFFFPIVLPFFWFGWRRQRKMQALHSRLQELVPAEARQRDPLLGLAVGEYRLIRRLGAGGMAAVYLAYPLDLDAERSVAIKLVHLQSEDAAARERFEKEIAVSIRLEHPNIVRVLDWGWQEARPYLVLELLDGQPLSQCIPAGGMPLQQAVALMGCLASALVYAHGRGIVHRDVKPENVMLTASGKVKLMDFGLARSHQSDTISGPAMGTPGYMSPEQIRGGEARPELSDQYSFGVTLFELLAGRRPYLAEEAFGVLRQQLEEAPPELSQFRPDLAFLDPVVSRMLSADPGQRYVSLEAAWQEVVRLAGFQG